MSVKPNKEHTIVKVGELEMTIRPITPNDTNLEEAFVHDLSLQTKYERFFEGIKDLSHHMATELCDVDGINTMAYLATINENGAEKEIGVCRYAIDKSPVEREMAITVADNYPFLEIASPLVEVLSEHAKRNGVKRLKSIELSSNYRMLKLAKHLGMSSELDPTDATLIVYSLDL
jgi:acetyltransferase